MRGSTVRKVATVFGGSGFIGRYVVQRLANMDYVVRVAVSHPDGARFLQTQGRVGQIVPLAASVADPGAVARAVAGADLVVNLVGILHERRPGDFQRLQAEGAGTVARLSAEAGVERLVHISAIGADPASPSRYGRTKAEGERRVLAADPDALVIRTSAFFGPWDEHNFVTIALDHLGRGLPFRAAGDAVVSPTYVPDLVNASLDLLIDGERGVWHLANGGEITWSRLAHDAAQAAGVSTRGLEEVSTEELDLPAPRPQFSALGSEKGGSLAPLADALARYLAERKAA